MNNDIEKVLDRIRKLIAKAEGTSNPHEAEAFMAKAMQLAAESQISLAEARMAGKLAGEPIKWIFQMGEPGQKAWDAMAILFSRTADNADVLAVFDEKVCHVWAYGFEEDISTALVLFSSLRLQMIGACEKYLERDSTATGSQRLAGRLSFYSTYTSRVASMLGTARARAETGAGGTAQIALRGKRGRVQDFMNTDLENLGRTSAERAAANSPTDRRAAAAGDAAARNARLNTNDNLASNRLELTS